MIITSDNVSIDGPVTAKVLATARNQVQLAGAGRAILVIRTWPEVHMDFMNIPGFHAVEEYDVEELDTMQRGEIGRVHGFHIVVRWNANPIKTKSGKFISEVVGGVNPFRIESEAQA